MPTILETVQAAVNEAFTATAIYAPRIVGAIAVLLIGWVAGRIVGRIVRAAVYKTPISHLTLDSPLGPLIAETEVGVARMFGKVAKWFVYALALLAAADVLAITILSQWLSAAIVYLPAFIGGFLIILIGFLVSDFVGDAIERTDMVTRVRYTPWIADGVRLFLYFTVIVIGLDTMGIDVSFLYIITGAIASGIALATAIGVGIALGLGGKDYVAENIDDWMSRKRIEETGRE